MYHISTTTKNGIFVSLAHIMHRGKTMQIISQSTHQYYELEDLYEGINAPVTWRI